MFSRLPLNSTMADGTTSYGRGVWESNPPGTAPSDPPAVLKTVRPTGAPTPPGVAVLCHSCLCLSSQGTDACYINLGEVFDHEFCLPKAREITITCDRDAAHSTGMSSFHSRYGILDDKAVCLLDA